MSNYQEEIKFEEIFEENLLPEIIEFFKNEQNKHILFLKNILKNTNDVKGQLLKLAEYGLDNINNEDVDFMLANYFFILSGIKNIHDDVRSFFTDMMIFCEEDKYTMRKNVSEIKNYYNKKILPLL